MSTTIEIGPSGCLANCAHCEFSSLRIQSEQLIGQISELVNGFLSTDPIWGHIRLDFASSVLSLSPELIQVIERRRGCVEEIAFSIQPEKGIGIKEIAGHVAIAREHYPYAQKLTLVFNRSVRQIETQWRYLDSVIDGAPEYLMDWNRVNIVMGSNEVPRSSIQSILSSAEMHLEERAFQARDPYRFIGFDSSSIHDFTSSPCHKLRLQANAMVVDVLFGCRIHDRTNNPGSYRDMVTHLNTTTNPLAEGIFVAGNRINLLHDAKTTNMPGVWVSFDEFRTLLSQVGPNNSYREVVRDHFARFI